ncbi:MAG: TusE/DsrC/DsvC family sulfur relay protein [Leptospiraceae bacterium]|nr:TusE/DsrC/DsvC family sulfur relay protein [Leptospiraceae bacterium]
MPEVKVKEGTVQLNDDGFLVNESEWNRDVAEAIARENKLELTDRHWVVIDFMRKDFQESGKSPTIRRITKNSGVDTKELYQLFPVRPGGTAARIAGVPKPEGCV